MTAQILVIDDDERIVRMLTRRLKKVGYQIYTAQNGKIGMEVALNLNPDLILMDMYMPVMNGYEATKKLRQQGYKGIIVALTASAMADDSRKSIKAGCNLFMSKPITVDFEEKIKNILKGK